MFHHLQYGQTPLMLGMQKKAASVMTLLVDKMRALGLGEDVWTAVDNNKFNMLHLAAKNGMHDFTKALLNGEEARVEAALAAQTNVMSGTTIVAVCRTVLCLRRDCRQRRLLGPAAAS